MIARPGARPYRERVNPILRRGPALVALGVLAACSSGSGTAPGTTTVTTTVTTTGSTATMSPPHVVATPPEGTPTTSTSRAGRVLRCDGPTLAVTVGEGDAAAGTIHYRILFTNRGSASCYLQGFPGVAAASAGGASKVNATRDTSTTATRVVLASRRSAHADLAVRNVPPTSAACPSYPLLLVTPPDSRRTSTISRSVQPCAGQMRVTVIRPGRS
jgi:hypothetical protein